MTDYSFTFADRMAIIRKRNNLTQAQFAERIFCSRFSVSAYERGTLNPSIDTVAQVAKAFDISADWLIGLTDTPRRLSDGR